MIIAVASGKGGTGKTFFATNLFLTLHQQNFRVQLIDCDAEAPDALIFLHAQPDKTFDVLKPLPEIDPNACTFCGKCHEYCHFNAIFYLPQFKMIHVMQELCHSCGACLVACPSEAIREIPVSLGKITSYKLNEMADIAEAKMNIGVMSPVPVIKEAIRHVNKEADIVILDAPPGTSCPFVHTVNNADFVILVTEPNPFGLSDLKQSIAILQELDKPFGVVINCAGTGNNDVNMFLKENGFPLLAEIPYSMDIARLYSRGIIAAEKMPALRKQFINIAEIIEQLNGNSIYQR